MKSQKGKQFALRCVECVAGLFIMAFGVALTKRAELGISPISSVPNVLSYLSLTVGTWMVIWNSILIVGQILVLRKNFKVYQLLQLPMSFIFGAFLDLGVWCVQVIPADRYWMRIVLVLVGVVIVALGIAMTVHADVIMNSGDALTKAIAATSKKNFGNVKVAFDVSCVVLSVILSLIFFHGRIVGTREGTVITALCTGPVIRVFLRMFTRHEQKEAVSDGQPAHT